MAGADSHYQKGKHMTNSMKRALTRVDGITSPVGPLDILGTDNTAGEDRHGSGRIAREARRRAQRLARTRGGVITGRVPRAIEAALMVGEYSDPLIHSDLVAADLL